MPHGAAWFCILHGAAPPEPGRCTPHLGQDGLLLKTKCVGWLFTHSELGHCQSPGDLACFEDPQAGQEAFLRKTPLTLLTQEMFGHCQSSSSNDWAPILPPPCDAAETKDDALGFNLPGMEPHFGQFALDPKTLFVELTQETLGHNQSGNFSAISAA